tara:strand:- start:101 stop:463 length:363 start_codon:yes stop_codon:yes gene_type:complete
MRYKTFEQYIEEKMLSSIKAGEESEVEIADQKTVDGTIISAQEILGQIIAADTENAFKTFFYDKYGSTKFDTETMGQMVTDYNDYYKEVAAKEKEDEKDGGDEGGGEEEGGDDPLAGMDI